MQRVQTWFCSNLALPLAATLLCATAHTAGSAAPSPIETVAPGCAFPVGNVHASNPEELPLYGLNSNAIVSGVIGVRAAPPSDEATVIFCIDKVQVWIAHAPFYLGPISDNLPKGFRLEQFGIGPHILTASAFLPGGEVLVAKQVPFQIVATENKEFSSTLTSYSIQGTAQSTPLEALLDKTSTNGAPLTTDELATRRTIFAMYVAWGIDPALDAENDQSELMMSQFPDGAAEPLLPLATALSMRFSPDSPYYHKIPEDWPHVALPNRYIRSAQLNEAYGGDGIGFGEVVASAGDPLLPVRSQWYEQADTLRTFSFRIPVDWHRHIPTLEAGDRHVIFVDPISKTFISSYKTSRDARTGGANGLYISEPSALESLGDRGGSNAAGFADLPVMIQPGEATDPHREIPHAIGGAVRRAWAARVYPAHARDAGILTSVDTCTQQGFMNTGLVPYGGIIQLDPALDLEAMHLSLPAYRILRAMQVYGYYVMDFGCADIDIYTAIDAAELEPFGGPWGNDRGPGVQNEIQGVLAAARLYVVPPLTKR